MGMAKRASMAETDYICVDALAASPISDYLSAFLQR
jgi:hypothetical protein